MNIVFNGSDQPTLGVEIEVQIVDEAGALATDTAATKILAELGDDKWFKHELLECCIEVITDVCPTVGHTSVMTSMQHSRSSCLNQRSSPISDRIFVAAVSVARAPASSTIWHSISAPSVGRSDPLKTMFICSPW